jgi:hypothetical protein
MSTPEKLRETLADVIAKCDEANGEYAVLNADYVSAAAKGEDAKADKLEIELERTRRLIQRLALRRSALESDIGSAEEVERAQRGAKLKATADSILARAGKRLADMEPLAAALAKLTDELESDFNDWKEARYFAQQSGATPEGFASQTNDALVRRVTDSLSMSRVRTSNISKELSRISVFQ